LVHTTAEKRIDWRYNHRLYTVDRDHRIMAMQPGELHANLERTLPGDFIVVQVTEPLMRQLAQQLGWSSKNLDLCHPHPASTDPALRRALEGIRSSLCGAVYDRGSACECPATPGVHAENLVLLVRAFIERCTDGVRPAPLPAHAPALVRRARDYLLASDAAPYDLEALTRECGSDEPFYLLHAFKRAFSICPSEFRRRVLVARTCEALAQHPHRSLELIARDAGWSGAVDHARRSNTLIRHFRRTLGITPDRFRRALRDLSPEEWRQRAKAALSAALDARARRA
jgi:AraC-like DNA-binding protein